MPVAKNSGCTGFAHSFLFLGEHLCTVLVVEARVLLNLMFCSYFVSSRIGTISSDDSENQQPQLLFPTEQIRHISKPTDAFETGTTQMVSLTTRSNVAVRQIHIHAQFTATYHSGSAG
jgi:hypothetical protein